ncbi:BRD4-interacting chromatin-remodeling complex-associated protein-like [Lingula anatina]|uniref:BRD4-interacting chromatin-remodeling complex-associated protein-like n=1 Tax=Lingula anatina TaxID=7574 RepID=A0A1S3J490_LINAN|nr:BRD4-interacting chromatin-remodeling complex-associated protein-like [Lingula anatina]|eukprot:XP_013405081.1 BRD4-interacting chromatin-remodeling complex-associated protein-like [Lingula anatina]
MCHCGIEMEDGRCLLDVINDPQALNDFLNSTDDEDSKFDPPTPNYDHSSPSQPQWNLSNGSNSTDPQPQITVTPGATQQVLNQTPSNKVIQGIQNTMGLSPRTGSPLLQVGAQQVLLKSNPTSSQQPVQFNQVTAVPQTHFVAQAAAVPQSQTVHQLVQFQNQTPGQPQIIQQGAGPPQTVILQQTPTRPQQNVVNLGQIRTSAPQQGINIVQGTTPSQISLQGTLIQTSAGKFLIQGQALVGQQVHVPGLGNIVLRPQVQSLQNIQTVQSNIVSSTTVPQTNSGAAQLHTQSGSTAQHTQVNGHVGTIGGQQIVLQGANQNQGLVLQTLPNVVKMQPGNSAVTAGGVSNQQGLVLTRAITTQTQPAQGASTATQSVLHRPLNQPNNSNVSLNIGGQVINLAQLQQVQKSGQGIIGHSSSTIVTGSNTIQTTAGTGIISQANPVQQQQQQGVAVQNYTGNSQSQNMQSSKTFIIHTQTPQTMAQNYNGPQKGQQVLQPQQLQQGQVFARQGGQAALQSSPQVSVANNLTNLQTVQQTNHTGNGDNQPNQGVIVNSINNSNNVNNQPPKSAAVSNANQGGDADNRSQVQNAQHVLARLQMQLKHLQSIPDPSEQQQRLIKRLQDLMTQVIAQTRQQVQQQGSQQQQILPQQTSRQQQQSQLQQSATPSLNTLLVQQNNGTSVQTSSATVVQPQTQTVLTLPQVIQNISVQSANPPAGKLPIPALTKVEQVLNKLTPEQREKLQSQLSRLTPEQQQLFYKHQQTLILQKLSQQQQKPVQPTAASTNSKVPIMVQQINKGVTQLRPIIIQQQQIGQPVQAQKDEQRGVKRPSSVLLQQMARDQQGVLKPDYKTPFKGYRDCVKRLMRYHVYYEKDAGPAALVKADEEFESQSQDFLDRYQGMLMKYRDLLWQDSMRKDPSAEMVMLDRIFIQDENKQLARDKQLVLEDPDAFEPLPILKPTEDETKTEMLEDAEEEAKFRKEADEEKLSSPANKYEPEIKADPSSSPKKEPTSLAKEEPFSSEGEIEHKAEVIQNEAAESAVESKVIPKLKISLKSERPSPERCNYNPGPSSPDRRNSSDFDRPSDNIDNLEIPKADLGDTEEEHHLEDSYLSDQSDSTTENNHLHSELTSNHMMPNPYEYEDISSDFNGNLDDDSPAQCIGSSSQTEVDTALEGLFTSARFETGHNSKSYMDYNLQCDNAVQGVESQNSELDSAINSLAAELEGPGQHGSLNDNHIQMDTRMDQSELEDEENTRHSDSDKDSQAVSELNTSQESENLEESHTVDGDISYFPQGSYGFGSPSHSMDTGDLNTEMESAINSILSLQQGEVSMASSNGRTSSYIDGETGMQSEEEPVMEDDLDAAVQSILM